MVHGSLFSGLFGVSKSTISNTINATDRLERIKALGNAIVPQVAYQIFKTIQQIEDTL